MIPNTFEDKLLYMEIPIEPYGDSRDPYPDYAYQRANSPVMLDYRFGENDTPLVFVYRHEDVTTVLQNNLVFSSKVLHNMMSPTMGEHVLIGTDEPAHGQYRKLLAPALRPKLIARWEDSLIRKVIDELIDGFISKGKAELVADFNFAVPARIVAQIVGVPQKDYEQFQLWAIDIVGAAGELEAGIEASQQLRKYLAEFVEERRINPQEDIISELVHTEIDGERLTEEEIYSFLLLLLPAGIETTYRSLGSLLFNLLTNPEQLQAVRKDRSLVARAIEENLRTDPPIQYPPRITTQETNLGGTKIPEGAIVVPILGAANRDPDFIENPDVFDIFRPTIRHITFGNGVHTCMGLHLAKLELGIVINSLLDRLPGLRFDWDKAKEIDAHIRGKSFRSPTAVPVLWDI